MDNIARLAAADLQDQVGEQREAIVEKSGVDTAFKPAARVRGQRQRLPGPGDAFGRLRDFEQHIGRVVGAARNVRRP